MKVIKIPIEIDTSDRDKLRDVIVQLKQLVKVLIKIWRRLEP